MSAGRCHHQDRVSGNHIIQPNSWGWWERLGAVRGAGHRFSPSLPSEETETPPLPPEGGEGLAAAAHQTWPRSELFAGRGAAAVRASCLPSPRREPSPCCRGLAGSGGLSAPHAGRELKAAHTQRGRAEQPRDGGRGPAAPDGCPRASLAAGASSPRHAAPPHTAPAHGELNRWGCVLVLSPHTILLGTA